MKGCGVVGKVLSDGFECPKDAGLDSRGIAVDHPKFAHPEDCQKFYVCLNGVTPREQGCSDGTVYNEEQQKCDAPENVPGWYVFEKKNKFFSFLRYFRNLLGLLYCEKKLVREIFVRRVNEKKTQFQSNTLNVTFSEKHCFALMTRKLKVCYASHAQARI